MADYHKFIQQNAEKLVNINVNSDFLSKHPSLDYFYPVYIEGDEEYGEIVLTSEFPYNVTIDSEKEFFNDVKNMIQFSYEEKLDMKIDVEIHYHMIENGYAFTSKSIDYDVKLEGEGPVSMSDENIELLKSNGIDYVDFINEYKYNADTDYKEYINNQSPNPKQAVGFFNERIYFSEE